MEGNPVCSHPNYRFYLLSLLSKLKMLDGKPITPADRADIGTRTRARGPVSSKHSRTCLQKMQPHCKNAFQNFSSAWRHVRGFVSIALCLTVALSVERALWQYCCRLSIRAELVRRAFGTHAVFARFDAADLPPPAAPVAVPAFPRTTRRPLCGFDLTRACRSAAGGAGVRRAAASLCGA
jgi:hypothetical protein